LSLTIVEKGSLYNQCELKFLIEKTMLINQNQETKDEAITIQLFKNVLKVLTTMKMKPRPFREMGIRV
jgi:hypothetical protein